MDIARSPRTKPKWRSRVAVGGGSALLAAIVVLLQARPAAPGVERAGVFVDTVKRGTFLRQVSAPGTLVPEHVRWITASAGGRVERVEVEPGAQVIGDSVIVELSNPDITLQVLESERQLAAAEAGQIELRTQLLQARLRQDAVLATVKAEAADAARRALANEVLLGKSMVSEVEAQQAVERAEEVTARLSLETQQAVAAAEAFEARLAAQRAQVAKLRAVVEFRRQQEQSLRVRAGGDGVVSELPVELGQWVMTGALLAKVVRPERLKAHLQVAEAQAKDLAVGQAVEVDTRNGVVPGAVVRVAPSASKGTVLVEVALRGELPKGARPDLSIEGRILIERVEDALFVGRPVGVQPWSTCELFRLESEDVAARTVVKFGRSSATTIEVQEGLAEGDKVIVSDTSYWDKTPRVRLR